MCLIVFAYRVHPQFPLVVAANRDEFYERPSTQAHFWKPIYTSTDKNGDDENDNESPVIFGGKDLVAGGMWMGITQSGRFAAVTNFREAATKQQQQQAPEEEEQTQQSHKNSRGSLVANFLKSTNQSALEYAAQLKAEKGVASFYGGFSLLVGDDTGMFYCSNRSHGSSSAGATLTKLQEGRIYGLSNRGLDHPWPKLVWSTEKLAAFMTRDDLPIISNNARLEALHSLLQDKTKPPIDQLPTNETGCSQEIEELNSSIFITSDFFGTRASSALIISTQLSPQLSSSQEEEEKADHIACSFAEWSYTKHGEYGGKVVETFAITAVPG